MHGKEETVINYLVPPLVDVQLAGPLRVDRVPLVWVDHHTEESYKYVHQDRFVFLPTQCRFLTRVGVDQLGDIASLQIPEDRSLIEVGHVGHIVELLHLGRVDLHHLGRLEGLGLPADLDVDLVSIDSVDHGLVKATFAIRDPDRFLGIWKITNETQMSEIQ